MGREVKRVPLDFDLPKGKIWPGYLNPYYEESAQCPDCDGGYSEEAGFLNRSFYRHCAMGMFGNFFGAGVVSMTHWTEERLRNAGWSDEVIRNIALAKKFGFTTLTSWGDKLDEQDVAALVKEGRLMDLTHDWIRGEGWKPKDPPVVPTPDEVNAWAGIGMGLDSISQHVLLTARSARYGVEDHQCHTCKGEARIWTSEEAKQKYESWTATEPPEGEGWQMWETVSEGSPISPVFSTPEALAHWLADTEAGAFADRTATYEQWLNMIKSGWAPSAVMSESTGLISGVEACPKQEETNP